MAKMEEGGRVRDRERERVRERLVTSGRIC